MKILQWTRNALLLHPHRCASALVEFDWRVVNLNFKKKFQDLQAVGEFGKSLSKQISNLLYSDNDTVVITSAKYVHNIKCICMCKKQYIYNKIVCVCSCVLGFGEGPHIPDRQMACVHYTNIHTIKVMLSQIW